MKRRRVMTSVVRRQSRAKNCKLTIANCRFSICILQLAICNLLLVSLAATADDDSSSPRRLCPYQTSHDSPLDAMQELVTEADDHTQFRVEFCGIRDDRVPAFLYLPKGDLSKRAAVLLQYGSGGHKGVDYIVALGHQF